MTVTRQDVSEVNDRYRRSRELYERALRTIPLGSQTFSKSAMQWVGGVSPLFLERGEGCRVWDVDGNEYVDYVLGLMPVVLGYCDPDVNEAIRHQLEQGITFSLATELEAELAERLVRIIPCAERVRFGKNGSDATLAATRLARAHTGRDVIAMCGYHGWHDWSIGTTSRNLGIPKAVRELTVTFPFNDAAALERIFKESPADIAAVILEPAAATDPEPEFLEQVKRLAHEHGALLIFDEIVAGFRAHLGGAQARYGVTPDLATFGKAMANGMPISAVVGRADIMSLMEEIFFSATFGGETLSLAAAIATLDKLEAHDGPARMEGAAAELREGVSMILSERGIGDVYAVTGPSWWPRIAVGGNDRMPPVLATSLLRQEFVANGLLMMSTFNLCLAHVHEAVVIDTLNRWSRVADVLAVAVNSDDPEKFLRGKPVRPVFQVRSS